MVVCDGEETAALEARLSARPSTVFYQAFEIFRLYLRTFVDSESTC